MNLRAILANAGMTVDNIVRLTSYLRDPAYVEANGVARVKALGERRIPTSAIIVLTLAEDWLIELEIIAMARTGLMASRPRRRRPILQRVGADHGRRRPPSPPRSRDL